MQSAGALDMASVAACFARQPSLRPHRTLARKPQPSIPQVLPGGLQSLPARGPRLLVAASLRGKLSAPGLTLARHRTRGTERPRSVPPGSEEGAPHGDAPGSPSPAPRPLDPATRARVAELDRQRRGVRQEKTAHEPANSQTSPSAGKWAVFLAGMAACAAVAVPGALLWRAAAPAPSHAAATAATMATAPPDTREKAKAKVVSGTANMSVHERATYEMQKLLDSSIITKLALVATGMAMIVIVGGSLYSRATGESLQTAIFKSYSLLLDTPGADSCSEESRLGTITANALFIIGICTFAVFLGLISDHISTQVEEVTKGNSFIAEKDHTVILNWNNCTVPLLRQLAVAHTEGRDNFNTIVVLADKPKAEMDEIVSDHMSRFPNSSKVITREGDPRRLLDLRRVAAWDAKATILLDPNEEADLPDEISYYNQESDKVATLMGLQHRAHKKSRVVVQMPSMLMDDVRAATVANFGGEETGDLIDVAMQRERGAAAAPRTDLLETAYFPAYFSKVYGKMMLYKVFGQCALQPGMSQVLQQLLVQEPDTPELYIRYEKRLIGKTFGHAWRCYSNASAIGIIQPNGKCILNVAEDYVLRSGDNLVFISENNNFRKGAPAPWAAAPLHTKAGKKMKTHGEAPHICVLGWNDKTPFFMDTLQEFAPPGTKVTVVSSQADLTGFRCKDWKYLKVDHVVGHPLSKATLQEANVDKASCVMMMHSDDNDISDPQVQAGVLLLAHQGYLKEGRVIAELHDEYNADMLRTALPRYGINPTKVEIISPDELRAGLITQVSSCDHLEKVILDLLDADGAEIYLAGPETYVKDHAAVAFGEICARARGMSEPQTAIGYIPAGGHAVINPPKTEARVYAPGDRLIVIADSWPTAEYR